MQLTLDVFSGRPNPSFDLPSMIGTKIFEMINDAGKLPALAATPFPARLGYRGLNIALPADIVQRYRVPPWLNISVDSSLDHLAIFKELLKVLQFFGFPKIDDLVKTLRKIVDGMQLSGGSTPGAPPAPRPTGPCKFDMLAFDPAPWNDTAFKPTNNCYAYASNKRASYPSKPQPGVGSGAIYTDLTGPAVSAAAKRDGAHDVNDCFPDTESPIMLVALVIWPGSDYHWYRKHPDCWGHKPGSTDARKIDNSGTVITNPETCDRGPYTEFTGYMLIPKSQKVAA